MRALRRPDQRDEMKFILAKARVETALERMNKTAHDLLMVVHYAIEQAEREG